MNPFLPRADFDHNVYHNNRKPTRTVNERSWGWNSRRMLSVFLSDRYLLEELIMPWKDSIARALRRDNRFMGGCVFVSLLIGLKRKGKFYASWWMNNLLRFVVRLCVTAGGRTKRGGLEGTLLMCDLEVVGEVGRRDKFS